jgi:hypothetical protein
MVDKQEMKMAKQQAVKYLIAFHPDWEKSEVLGVAITDITTVQEFEKRWTKLPNHIQNEFNYDLPLFNFGDFRESVGGEAPAKTSPRKRTFDEYVEFVAKFANKNDGGFF